MKKDYSKAKEMMYSTDWNTAYTGMLMLSELSLEQLKKGPLGRKMELKTKIDLLDIRNRIKGIYANLEYLEDVIKTILDSMGIDVHCSSNMDILKLSSSFILCSQDLEHCYRPLNLALWGKDDIDFNIQIEQIKQNLNLYQEHLSNLEEHIINIMGDDKYSKMKSNYIDDHIGECYVQIQDCQDTLEFIQL